MIRQNVPGPDQFAVLELQTGQDSSGAQCVDPAIGNGGSRTGPTPTHGGDESLTIRMHPDLSAGPQLVTDHYLSVIALLLGERGITHNGERGPALSDCTAPQLLGRSSLPVSCELRSIDGG